MKLNGDQVDVFADIQALTLAAHEGLRYWQPRRLKAMGYSPSRFPAARLPGCFTD